MQKRALIIALLIVLTGLLAYSAPTLYQEAIDLVSTSILKQEDKITRLLPAGSCDLSKNPCEYRLPDGGKLTLDIQPRPIRPLKTLQFDVRLIETKALSIRIDLAGTDMNMGLNQAPLTELESGHFVGQGSLSVCTTGPMRWTATLLLETPTERLGVPFLFETALLHERVTRRFFPTPNGFMTLVV